MGIRGRFLLSNLLSLVIGAVLVGGLLIYFGSELVDRGIRDRLNQLTTRYATRSTYYFDRIEMSFHRLLAVVQKEYRGELTGDAIKAIRNSLADTIAVNQSYVGIFLLDEALAEKVVIVDPSYSSDDRDRFLTLAKEVEEGPEHTFGKTPAGTVVMILKEPLKGKSQDYLVAIVSLESVENDLKLGTLTSPFNFLLLGESDEILFPPASGGEGEAAFKQVGGGMSLKRLTIGLEKRDNHPAGKQSGASAETLYLVQKSELKGYGLSVVGILPARELGSAPVKLLLAFIPALLLGLLILVPLAYYFSSFISRPITEVASELRLISGQLEPDADAPRNELEYLQSCLVLLKEAIQESWEEISEALTGYGKVASAVAIQPSTLELPQMAERLKEGYLALNALISTIHDAIFVLDENGIITFFSKGAEEVYRRKAEDVLGTRVHDLVIPQNRWRVERHIESVLETGGLRSHWPAHLESVHIRGDGSLFPVEMSLSWYRWRDGYRFTVISRDLTERKRMEEELLLREKTHLLGMVTATVAHELRSPLAVIKNSAYLMRLACASQAGKVDETAHEKMTKYVESVEKMVDASNAIISDLLGYVREQKAEPTVFDLTGLLEEVVTQGRFPPDVDFKVEVRGEEVPGERAGARGSIVAREGKVTTPDEIQVYADRNQVRQIVDNLLGNAFQAIKEADRIAQEVNGENRPPVKRDRRVTVRFLQGGETVDVEVSDSGPGIKESDIPRIFEPFFTTRAKGVGLGLAVARKLTLANGGELTVESQEGVGTTFRFTLPTRPGDSGRVNTV